MRARNGVTCRSGRCRRSASAPRTAVRRWRKRRRSHGESKAGGVYVRPSSYTIGLRDAEKPAHSIKCGPARKSAYRPKAFGLYKTRVTVKKRRACEEGRGDEWRTNVGPRIAGGRSRSRSRRSIRTARRWPRPSASLPAIRRSFSPAKRANSNSALGKAAGAGRSCCRAGIAPRASASIRPTTSAISSACSCRWRWS